MQVVLGIDIGGTSVKAGAFTTYGELLASGSVPTGAIADASAYERVMRFLRKLLAEVGASGSEVSGVGVDVPGPVDASGRVVMLPNITLDARGLRHALRQAFPQSSFALVNDANAAALGEYWQGAARDADSVVLVAVGTGVGGGVVVGGQLVTGAFGAGGEIGHLTVNPSETEPCGCGRHGCLEQYASATGVVRAYLRECAHLGIAPVALAGPADTLAVFDSCERGDQAAQAAIDQLAQRLGYALAQISVVIDPSLFLVGGGVSGGWDLFGDRLQAAFRKHCLPASRSARIMPAALGNAAALYGSAYLAMRTA